MAQAGDEDMQAAGIEKRIVAPDIHQQGFHRHDLACIPAEVLQHFGFAGRKFRHHAVAREPLALGVETHTPQFEHTFRTRFPDARTPASALTRTISSLMAKGLRR